MLGAPIQTGAHLFIWIVCILIAFLAAVSFIDFSKEMSTDPSDPLDRPEDNEAYWASRKHAEDVHREFPKGQAREGKVGDQR